MVVGRRRSRAVRTSSLTVSTPCRSSTGTSVGRNGAKRFAEEGRAGDNPESFKVRLDAYLAQTAPLVPYYERQGKVRGVDGMAGIEDVATSIAAAIDTR